MKLLSVFTAITTSAVLLSGCASDAGDELSILEEPAVDTEEKADEVEGLYIYDKTPFAGADERRTTVLTSNAQFQEMFGEDAPDFIDFDRRWALYYAPGSTPTGGYSAEITRAQLSASGRTITFWNELSEPGSSCAVTQEVTTPGALAVVAKPGPETTRFSTRTEYFTRECEQLCGDEMSEQLVHGARDAFYLSEGDVPYTFVSFDGTDIDEVTVDNVIALTGEPEELEDFFNGGTRVNTAEEMNWAEWIEEGTFVEVDEDEFSKALARDMRELQQAAESQLSDLKVFDIGAEPSGDGVRPLYILGRTKCGKIAGYVTTIVAT